jgi:hypothetical protein
MAMSGIVFTEQYYWLSRRLWELPMTPHYWEEYISHMLPTELTLMYGK